MSPGEMALEFAPHVDKQFFVQFENAFKFTVFSLWSYKKHKTRMLRDKKYTVFSDWLSRTDSFLTSAWTSCIFVLHNNDLVIIVGINTSFFAAGIHL